MVAPAKPRDIIAFTGIRDLAVVSIPIVERAIAEVCHAQPAPALLVFGGALGSDTVALAAAHKARALGTELRVIVPTTVDAQPTAAAAVIRRCADTVVELRASTLNWDAYRARNEAMLDLATHVVAFWDGQYRGGTGSAIRSARRRRLQVEVVTVVRGR